MARLIDQPGDLPAAVRGIRENTWIPGHEALAVRKRSVESAPVCLPYTPRLVAGFLCLIQHLVC